MMLQQILKKWMSSTAAAVTAAVSLTSGMPPQTTYTTPAAQHPVRTAFLLTGLLTAIGILLMKRRRRAGQDD